MIYPEETVQSQYAASPTIRALVDGFNAEIDPRTDISLFHDKIFNPSTAEGVGLDWWARIVGIERNIYVDELDENFGFFVTGSQAAASYSVPAAVQALTGYGWSAGDVYNYVDFDRKVYVQNVASVDLGTLDWYKTEISSGSGTYRFTATLAGMKAVAQSVVANMLCANYTTRTAFQYTTIDKSIACSGNTSAVGIHDSAYYDVTRAQFRTAMSGVYLYYELATPIETDISSLLDSTPLLPIESGTAITFANSLGTDYCIPVPSKISYGQSGGPTTDSTVAYEKTVNDLVGYVTVNNIGGRTLVFGQYVPYGDFTSTTGWNFNSNNVSFSVTDGVATLTAVSAGTDRYCTRTMATYTIDHIYVWSVEVWSDTAVTPGNTDYNAFRLAFGGSGSINYYYPEVANEWVRASGRVKAQATGTNAWIRMYTNQTGVTHKYRNIQVFDLTQIFGAGNEPATADDFFAMFPGDYYEYGERYLISAGVSDIDYLAVAPQDWRPWDQGVFWEPDAVKKGTYRIDDTAFRKLIFWKALANISTADCYTLNRLLTKLFGVPCIVLENGVMKIRILTTRQLEQWQKSVLTQYGLFGKPAGVGYEFLSIELPVLGFVEDGTNYGPFGQAPFYDGAVTLL